MSLHSFLTRLIWLCVLPLVLLAAYLAVHRVQTMQAERDLEAANLAKNVATAIDQNLTARIGALHMLAVSPLADDASRRKDLYQEAQGFRQSFGSHVILADLEMHMLFNTSVPFGTALPMLPRPKGHAAAPTAVETGKPAVGDSFFGPVAREPLVAIAVPAQREGKTAFLLLTIFETRQFQKRLDQVALPAGWSLALLDGKDEVIARRAPPGLNPATDVGPAGRFVVKSALSPWTVMLEIPRDIYRAPLVAVATALAIAILGATLAGVFGGMLASRRLGKSVASLVQTSVHGDSPPDITEIAAVRRLLDEAAKRREAAETAMRESEQRFRATFEQAAVGIAVVAPDGRWLLANQKLCDIIGYSHGELLTKTFQDITHPDDLDADLAYVRQMLAGEIQTYAMEKRCLRKDGTIVWINLAVALVRRHDGSPNYFISVVEDIQRRKEAEAALQAREDTLREAQRLAGLGNWTWDLRADRHVWSEEIYRIYGRDPSLPPAVYPEVQAYFAPDSWARLAAAVETGLAQGTPYDCDAEVARADGTRRWITARGKATRDADGTVVELHGTVQDITERKRAEEEIRKLNEGLEARVRERTAELARSNAELEQFAYVASHDLQEPLRMVVGYVQLMDKRLADKLDADTREFMGFAVDGALRMQRLIQDILAYSRVSTRGQPLEPVNSAAALAEARALLARRIAETGAEVDAQFLPIVTADRVQLVQLFQNLIGNAIKFCTERAPRIRVEARREPNRWRFSVIDNGIGIAPEYRERIFGIFQRLHTRREFPGTGIGLAICKRIVERHGGEVGIESAPGGGSVFWFTLPEEPSA